MDDMRERYRLPRRDYAQPPRRPMANPPRPALEPAPRPAPPAPSHPAHPAGPVPHQVAAAPAARHHQAIHNRRPKKRRLLKTLIVLLILALIAGGGFLAHQKYSTKNPFPADIRQNASVDLLYPTKLPTGYTIDSQSINLANGILIYDAKQASGNNRIVFTIQKTPSNFDFNTFYKQQLSDSRQVTTPYGTAQIGRNAGRALGSLVDDQTWLILSTNNTQVSQNDFSQIMSNLKVY